MKIELYFGSASQAGTSFPGAIVEVENEIGEDMIRRRVGKRAADGAKVTPLRAPPENYDIDGNIIDAAPAPDKPEPYLDEVARRRRAK